MEIRKLEGIIEAILFTMGGSVELGRLAGALEEPQERIREAIAAMQERYRAEDRGINIVELEGAYQMCTKPEAYDYLIRIAKQPKKQVLTDVLLETLSIIAYKQPVTKIEIEKIRGVKSDHAVNKLVEYNLACEGWMRPAAPFYLERQKSFYEDSVSRSWRIFRESARNRWNPLKKRLKTKQRSSCMCNSKMMANSGLDREKKGQTLWQ